MLAELTGGLSTPIAIGVTVLATRFSGVVVRHGLLGMVLRLADVLTAQRRGHRMTMAQRGRRRLKVDLALD